MQPANKRIHLKAVHKIPNAEAIKKNVTICYEALTCPIEGVFNFANMMLTYEIAYNHFHFLK